LKTQAAQVGGEAFADKSVVTIGLTHLTLLITWMSDKFILTFNDLVDIAEMWFLWCVVVGSMFFMFIGLLKVVNFCVYWRTGQHVVYYAHRFAANVLSYADPLDLPIIQALLAFERHVGQLRRQRDEHWAEVDRNLIQCDICLALNVPVRECAVCVLYTCDACHERTIAMEHEDDEGNMVDHNFCPQCRNRPFVREEQAIANMEIPPNRNGILFEAHGPHGVLDEEPEVLPVPAEERAEEPEEVRPWRMRAVWFLGFVPRVTARLWAALMVVWEAHEPEDDEPEDDEVGDAPIEADVNPHRGGYFPAGPVRDMAGSDNQIVDNFGGRKVRVTMAWYNVPKLEFYGVWNANKFSGPTSWYNRHSFGWHFDEGHTKRVKLPSTMVAELKRFWSYHSRSEEDLLKCAAYAQNWLRGIGGITAEQMAQASLYAPVLAMLESDGERQNLLRFVHDDYSSWVPIAAFSALVAAANFFWYVVVLPDRSSQIIKNVAHRVPASAYDILGHVASYRASLFNALAASTAFDKPIVDCDWWLLPSEPVAPMVFNIAPTDYYVCAQDYNREFWTNFVLAFFVFMVYCCTFVVMYWRKCNILALTTLEDALRIIANECLSRVSFVPLHAFMTSYAPSGVVAVLARVVNVRFLPSLSMGVAETALTGRFAPFLFHTAFAFLSTVPDRVGFTIMFQVGHIIWNCWFPDQQFNMFVNVARYLKSQVLWRSPRVAYKLSLCDKQNSTQREDSNVSYGSEINLRKPREHTPQSQYLLGIGSGKYRPVAYASNRHNEEVAVNARITNLTPPLDEVESRRCYDWVLQNWRRLLPGFTHITSVSFETYIKKSNASASVKRLLIRTKAQLDREGITEHSHITEQMVHEWTKRKAFVKVENNPYRTPAGRKNKACRLIQGAAPEFIVLVGPWMMAFQKMVKRKWSSKNFMCFTSGVSSLDAARVVDKPSWEVLEDDIGAFDASVDALWLRLEYHIFKKCGAPLAVLQLIFANIDTRGTTSQGVKYRRRGMRKSGDPYTSVGNSLLNGFFHIYIWCDETHETVEQARSSICMVIQGDDNLLCHRYLDHRIEWVDRMRDLGFDSEATYRRDILDAEFCSNLVYKCDKGLVFGPKPGRVISKLGYFINPPNNIDPKSLVRGTALGLYSACSHIAPLRAYLDHLLLLTDGCATTTMARDEWKMKYVAVTEEPATSITLYRRYGWTTKAQVLWEQALTRQTLGTEMRCSLAEWLCDRDTAGPAMWFK